MTKNIDLRQPGSVKPACEAVAKATGAPIRIPSPNLLWCPDCDRTFDSTDGDCHSLDRYCELHEIPRNRRGLICQWPHEEPFCIHCGKWGPFKEVCQDCGEHPCVCDGEDQ